jgi:hypothetical protein
VRIIRNLGLGLALCVTPAHAEPAAPICARGAVATPLPLTYALELEAADYSTQVAMRADFDLFTPEQTGDLTDVTSGTTLAMAIEWPGVLADRAAELPKPAHDLPWLILLAQIDSTYGDPVTALTQGIESILTPDLLPLMQRNGMAAEARVLRTAMDLFPEWGLNPADRTRQLIGPDGSTVNETLQAGLDAASRAWPTGQNRARDAAMAIIAADPQLLTAFQARLAVLDDHDRLGHLTTDLWQNCMTDWYSSDESDQAYAAMGSAQAALLLMDALSYADEPPSLYYWFEARDATQTATLARLLDRRGLTDLAQALRAGMALFPQPFPRFEEDRWAAMQAMDEVTLDKFYNMMPPDAYERLRADMIILARDAGLLPQ